MNKLFNKIAAGVVGLAMAVGVGVAIGSHSFKNSVAIQASSPATVDITSLGWGSSQNAFGEANAEDIDSNTAFYFGGGANAGKYYTTSPAGARMYYSGSDTITVKAKSTTVKLTSVTFTYNVKNTGCLHTTKNTSVTAAYPSGTAVALSNVSSVTASIASTGTATNSQVAITSISVSYTVSGSTISVTGVSVAPTTATIKVGKTTTLTPTITPNNASNQSVTWSTSNSSIATVSGGVVTGVSAGSATITVTTSDGGYTATCAVTVQAIQTYNVSVADARTAAAALTDGDTTADLYCVTGYVTNVSYTWTSSNGVSFSLADAKDGTPTLEAFKIKCSQEIGLKVLKDAQLTVTGNLKNYGGTYEVINNSGVATPITILQEAGTEYPEPASVTGQELSDLFANTDGNYKQLYQVTGVVSAWKSGESNGTKYGNFYLQEPGNTSTSYYIYGATATADRLIWNKGAGNYVFSNPQDFLTNETTKNIVIGDTVTMKLTRCDYNSTQEATGIVVSVTHAPTISLDKDTLTVTTGSTGTLEATVENAPSAVVSWSSSDTSVATVSGGTVTGVAVGTATITASITVDSKTYSATCEVTVSAPVQQVVSIGDEVMIYYDTHFLTDFNNGSYGTAGSEADAMVFTVVAGYSTGSVAFENNGQYLYCDTVKSLELSSDLDGSSSWNAVGTSLSDVTISCATESSWILQYNSNSPRFACYAGTQKNALLKLVDNEHVSSVSLDESSATIAVNGSVTLTATVLPSTALDKSVSWSSSNTSVATVSNGVVTGVAAGSATITVTTTDGGFTATCEITVVAPSSGEWVETPITSLTSSDVFVIVGNNGSNYAMSNNNGTGSAPAAVAVTVADGKITSAVPDSLKWNVTASSGSYVFAPNGDDENALYCTNTNNGIRVGTNGNTAFTVDSESEYLVNTATSRYIGVYNSQDWRCYTSINANIEGQTFAFYKYVVSYTASDFADEFLETLSTGSGHVCDAQGNTNLSSLKAEWKTFAGKWTDVSNKTAITGVTPSESGDKYQKTLALYRYIAEKYNTQLQDSQLTDYNFMGIQDLNPRSSGRVSIFNNVDTQSGTAIAITVASILSVAALGGYFFLKKKKVTK